MAQERMIIIENDETHEQYAVQPEDYEREQDGAYAGYSIVSNEDGTPYETAGEEPVKDAPAKKKES